MDDVVVGLQNVFPSAAAAHDDHIEEDVDMILSSMQPLDCEESFDDCRFEPSLIPYPFVSFE